LERINTKYESFECFLPGAGHSTHFQVGGENQKVEGGVCPPSGGVAGFPLAENKFKDFRGQKKYFPEQQKVLLLHAFFQIFLLIFSFACIYFSFLVHFFYKTWFYMK
jgi:hypothetical protein